MKWENEAPFDCLLFSNVSVKNYQNWLMYVEVVARRSSVFFGTHCPTKTVDDGDNAYIIFIYVLALAEAGYQ